MLKLDRNDRKILSALKKSPLHPSALSSVTGLARTTISYRLLRLKQFKFVSSEIKGRKSVWKITPSAIFGKDCFRLYKDDELIHAYNELLRLPKNSVVLSVQGYEAALNELKHLPHYFIQEAHRVFKRKNIVIKAIINKKTLRCFEGIDKALLKSHIGRGIGLTLFEDDTFTSSAECMSTKNFLLISNPHKRLALVIKDKSMCEMIYQILEIVFDTVKNQKLFDLNRYLRIYSAT